ncbi:Ig-like domain-containing protein [Micromonospora sp. DT81.3]|uniref:Ig-like domain-containing protein n=1 Tax=Micromonospora sp. DT81.3 TaxID=3416523 RepID=UPI003CEC30CD
MTPMTHTRRLFSRAAIAVAAVITLVASASSAYAAEPPTIVIPTTGGTTSEDWSLPSAAVSSGATSLTIFGLSAAGATAECALINNTATLVSATFTAEEWDAPAGAQMVIPAGALSPGAEQLICTSAGAEGEWRMRWFLGTSPGSTNIFAREDPYLVVEARTFDSGPPHVISPGATVLLEGPWEYADPEFDGYASAVLTSSDRRFAPINLPASTSSDGLVVQIPSDLPAGFTDAAATLAGESGYSRQAPETWAYRTAWSGPVTFEAAAPSSTFLALERRVGTSRERLTASALVKSSAGVVAGGTIDFFVDEKLVGSVAVDAKGRASLELPKLARGKHVVVATFRGTGAVKSSSSAASSLRILI